MIRIDKNVPLPSQRGSHGGPSAEVFRQVPWQQLKPNDSVLLPKPEHLTPRQWMMQCNNRAHLELGTGRYRVRIEGENCRVWCISKRP